MAETVDTTRRGFLRMAPAGLIVGTGLGMTLGKTLDEQIAEHVDALKELWAESTASFTSPKSTTPTSTS